MTEEQKLLEEFNQRSKEHIQRFISKDKKNIAVVSYYPTYRSQFGNLITKLKEKYNVITIVDRVLNDDFEKSGHHNVFFPWRVTEANQTYYPNVDIEEIDLILVADQVGYEDGRIDREFLSKRAKRIYFPHRATCVCGATATMDYIIVPSKTAMQGFQYRLKGNPQVKLLPSGYPQLDKALQEYQYTPKNTITYAPTLRYVENDRNARINAFAGSEITFLEWLLENTNYNISYRAHPLNYSIGHYFYRLINASFAEEARFSIDANMGNAFFNSTDFLITDWSTTSFTYSYTTLRPSFMFMPTPLDSNLENDGGYILENHHAKNLKELKTFLDNIDFTKEAQYFKALRDENMYNLGHSVEAILQNIEEILEGKL
ncbi:CDP-glycerol glycerophosphotransferase family protein [Helicobacter winghamensis]|uniref:CDP-glycerol glycerophosphotransferase family protein n=1 Tax=Helicobacter winghamensis TaxID=157268 RepID=UPI0001A2869C|nr:CDP-glycerol glycerophosphotransferase family protein [Helicobacter winghamensis]EEO25485.1 CDP-glycerol:poly(glycerophosphate) glycerophosphotransferase [Helicobacter winghamensis ATCC BAA-430]PKT78092.1 hypothetical protein BCM34_02465 [Helicobacter winghamensis]PKT78620.1 hypothetical protein BCM35_00755 [Helicobacter winghamensis]QOQ97892.1 CDP-glycerol glycerophosphotransferase family protein [Helicobacter winghamensis]